MVVGREYMLKKTTGPSAPKLFLDTKVVPAAVNLLGGLEVGLDRTAARTGLSVRTLLAGAAGAGSIGLYWLLTRARTRPGVPALPKAKEPDRSQ